MLADLFEPFQLGDLTLANRMVMAPMMRNRADENGIVDLVAFGILFLANPDLVRRYRENLPLNAADPSAFYGGGLTLGARLAGEVIS